MTRSNLVTLDMIRAVAALAPPDPSKASTTPSGNGRPSNGGRLNLPKLFVGKWLADHGVNYKEKEVDGSTHYILEQCPFDHNHGSKGESAIVQKSNGMLTFSCKHDSCSGRRWADVKDVIGKPDPQHYDRPPQQKKQSNNEAPPEPEPIVFDLIDSTEFAQADYRSEFLIDKILVRNEPCMIAGKQKTLKTSIALDLALSLGSGLPFLGTFRVPKRRTVAVFSGESGLATLQRTAKQIAKAKDIDLRDVNVFWCSQLPQLARNDHLEAMGKLIQAKGIDVICLDPAYLALLAGDTEGRRASDIFSMGPLLLKLTELGRLTDATVILIHHLRKNLADSYSPPELEDMSMAGFAEWSRQWLLLARQEKYSQGSGVHRLWLNVGGSAGHSSLHAATIDEGTIDENFDGRRWDVQVETAADARAEAAKRKQEARQRKAKEKAAETRAKLHAALLEYPGGETARVLRETIGVSGAVFNDLIEDLQTDGVVVPCKVEKFKVEYDGFKLHPDQFEEEI